MSSARSAAENAFDPDAVADALGAAPFVRVWSRATGDAIAASGVLARACRALDVPFQIRPRPSALQPASADDGVLVTVGTTGGDVTLVGGATPASVRAAAVARCLGVAPDPTLALAGVVASGETPGSAGSDLLEEAALERRPGVGVPTANLAAGLAHSTLLSAPFSGDEDAAQHRLAELELPATLDDDAHRRVASLVAIDVATAEEATPNAASSVERALRPHPTPDGPFETLEGYADVLDVVAREAPGTAVALAFGHDAREAALDAWRTHAAAAHRALHGATTGRYDGLYVARVSMGDADGQRGRGRLETAARLLRDFRSPEPVALVVGRGALAAASATSRDLDAALREALAAVTDAAGDADVVGDDHVASAALDSATDDVDETDLITAIREAL